MDLDYLYYKKMVKSKRQRERNWDRNEKKCLIRLVQRYRPIIDNKGNDSVWVRRKNAAWDAIQRGMVAEGFRRGVKSVRQQWARTKGDAKRKQKIKIKKEKLGLEIDIDQVEDDSQAVIQISNADTDPLDYIVKKEECEPQEPSDNTVYKTITINDDSDGEDQTLLDDNLLMSVDEILTSIPSPMFDHTESSGIGSTTPSTNESTTEALLPPPRPTERKLPPKVNVGRNVLHARLRQIEEETAQRAEIHSLEVSHREEVHALQVQQMREQIEQQRRLFEAQMAKLQC